MISGLLLSAGRVYFASSAARSFAALARIAAWSASPFFVRTIFAMRNVRLDRGREVLIADDEAAALLKGLDARRDAGREHIAIRQHQHLECIESVAQQLLLIDHLRLKLRVQQREVGFARRSSRSCRAARTSAR